MSDSISKPSSHHRQGGFGTVAAVGALVGLGVIFLLLFFLSGSPSSNNVPSNSTGQNNNQQQSQEEKAVTSTEPPFIRIPENSFIYRNTTYGFMFAYPDSFGSLSASSTSPTSNVVLRVESAEAVKKPVGIGTAYLNGPLGVYLYKKDDFKITVNASGTYVAPTKTGNDTTWKIVDRGSTSQDIKVGDSYQSKTIRSQTGVPVFDFTYKTSSSTILGRYVFELKDYYAIIALPNATKPDNTILSEGDVVAYNIIGLNIAKTVRLPSTSSTENNTNTTGTNNNSD